MVHHLALSLLLRSPWSGLHTRANTEKRLNDRGGGERCAAGGSVSQKKERSACLWAHEPARARAPRGGLRRAGAGRKGWREHGTSGRWREHGTTVKAEQIAHTRSSSWSPEPLTCAPSQLQPRKLTARA